MPRTDSPAKSATRTRRSSSRSPNNATQAVLVCPELKETIKSDPAAQPLRDALAESLTLNALTGELLVLRDSEW